MPAPLLPANPPRPLIPQRDPASGGIKRSRVGQQWKVMRGDILNSPCCCKGGPPLQWYVVRWCFDNTKFGLMPLCTPAMRARGECSQGIPHFPFRFFLLQTDFHDPTKPPGGCGCLYAAELWDGVAFVPGDCGFWQEVVEVTDCTCDTAVDPVPIPPIVPPVWPPDPTPTGCARCGAKNRCGSCTCTPVGSTIRVGISDVVNCPCVGPCGVYPGSFAYGRMADGFNVNGTYDLFQLTDCEWMTTVAMYVEYGSGASLGCPPGPQVISVTLHLKRLDGATWVFSVYVNTMDANDPRNYAPDDPTYNFRVFSGYAITAVNECMKDFTMHNQLVCGCSSSLSSDGRFDVTSGGGATFTILCP